MKKRLLIPICAIAIIITTILAVCKTDVFKVKMSRDSENITDYKVEEKSFIIEMENIDIDIRYPKILTYPIDSSQIEIFADHAKQAQINKLLIPPEIEIFNEMIADGLIKISDSGEFIYDSSSYTFPHTYALGMSSSYTMGFMNNDFLNLYRRSNSYIRNGDWNYGAILIDLSSGTQIMPDDFLTFLSSMII